MNNKDSISNLDRNEHNIDLQKYLAIYSRDSLQNPNAYGLKSYVYGRESEEALIELNGEKYHDNVIWLDSQYAFRLFYETEVIAIVGFRKEYDQDTILIKQIQGRKGQKSKLEPIKWERMLVNIVYDWSRENGFRRTCVQLSSENDHFGKSENVDLHVRHDVTARRFGAEYDHKLKAFVLNA